MTVKNRVALVVAVAAIAVSARVFALQVGDVAEWRAERDSLVLRCAGADVALSFLEGNIVRIEVVGEGIQRDFPSFLTAESGPRVMEFIADEEKSEITAGDLLVRISGTPFGFEVTKGDRSLLKLAPGGIEWKEDGSYTLTFEREKGDAFLGLGEPPPDLMGIPLKLDHKKTIRTIWNTHRPPSDLGLPLYYNPRGYGLFIDNPWRAELDLGSTGPVVYSAAGGPVRFFVIEAPDALAFLDRYTAVTGKPPMPPRWTLGYMQSRYGYETEKDFRWLMTNFRERKIPCDTLIFDLDWFGKGAMGNFWWNYDNFPKPEEFMAELESNGFKTIVITEPYVFTQSYNYLEARKEKYFTKSEENGQVHTFLFWGRPASMLDYTNPKTRKWYGEKIKRLKETGVDAWWTDLNEPEKDDGAVYRLGPKDAGHNLQALLMNMAIRDMYDEYFPDDRLLMMTRSGFAGIQRLGSGVWSGDVQASWNHLRDQIPIALSAGLSGLHSWNSDTGGFHDHPSPELYVRWIQFSAFNPLMRSHGNHNVREPWSFGDEAERICKKYLELRMRLIPYLYTLYYESHKTGAPIMRPMFMHDPDADIDLATQFFYGKDIIVAPVTEEGAKKKQVYLPAGGWYYFWDDRVVRGPKTVSVPVDLDTTPVFVREGGIIPMAPVMQYTTEKKADPLTIHYYIGPAPTVFELYEDDGATRGYGRGEYMITEIGGAFKDGAAAVRVSEPRGGMKTLPEPRAYEIFIHGVPGPGFVSGNGLPEIPVGEYIKSENIYKITTQPVAGAFNVVVLFKK